MKEAWNYVKANAKALLIGFALGCIAAGASSALAEEKALMAVEGDSYVLSDFSRPCTVAAAMATVPGEFRAEAKQAEGMYEGEVFEVCVVQVPVMRAIAVHWEDGTYGLLSTDLWVPADRSKLPTAKPKGGLSSMLQVSQTADERRRAGKSASSSPPPKSAAAKRGQ